MKSVIIIPARLGSTRLPRKLLLRETGKSLLRHTYEAASKSQRASKVIVAADDPEIVAEVESFGGNVVMTDPNHTCGTDRIAEVANDRPEFDLFINVQGDEPEISADAIDLAITLLEQNPDVRMSTLATPICDRESFENPNCVKVVVDRNLRALYFSRSPIPHPRKWDESLLTTDEKTTAANFLQHVGLYGYRREFLLTIPSLPPAPMEKIESLEQLRVLFNGYAILVGIINDPICGIDTAEDYGSFVRRQSNC